MGDKSKPCLTPPYIFTSPSSTPPPPSPPNLPLLSLLSNPNLSNSQNPYTMAAERSNFAQTCNLLSQYLKEKRSQYLQGDTTFGSVKPVTPPATMNLLNSMDAGPAQLDQPRSAPMTIFYGGQVLVFNDLSPEKAKEIMSLATKGSPVVVSSSESSPVVMKPQQQQLQAPQVVAGSDLPIMRRASLHKFLAKRKERVIAVAPYQLNQTAASPKAEEQVGGQSSKQLELRL